MKKIRQIIKKYKKLPVAAKAAAWFVFCSMLQKCISFLTVPIFTRLMPTEEYGLYSTYLSWFAILTTFCTLNMHSVIYVNQYTKANSEEEKNKIAIPLISLAIVITLSFFIMYIMFSNFFNKITGLTTIMTIFLFIQILFEIPISYWNFKKRFEFKYISMVLVTILLVIINSLLGIVFVYFVSSNHATARALSIALGYGIVGSFLYINFFKRAKQVFSTKGWKHALEVELPLLPHSLSLNILTSSDRIMVRNLVGLVEAGIYSVAYSAGYIVNVLKTSIVDALKPWIYSKLKTKEYEKIKNAINMALTIVIMITIVFISFGPEIIRIMAPKNFEQAIYVIPPVAASSFFTFLYNVFSIIGMYYEKTRKIMIASISGAILNIILNLIFIPIFGFVAAGFTTLICYMIFAYLNYHIMKSISKTKLENVEIYDMKYIIKMCIVVLSLTITYEIIYKYILIRYSIILAIILISIIYRKKILSITRGFKNIKGGKK